MAEFLSPGVFIEEVTSAVQTIAAVSTSNMGIVGFTRKGPTDEATLVTSSDQFFRLFGDLSPDTYMGLSVLAFFANGGRRCFVVRVMPSDAVASDVDIQSKTYDQQIETGTGVAVAFTKTALNTQLKVTSGASPVIGYNGQANLGFGLRWRGAGTAVAAQQVKQLDGTTNVTLVNGTNDYEFRIATASLPAFAEEDWKQMVVIPGTVSISFDPDGGGARTITITAPVSGTVSTVFGNGLTTDTKTKVVFDHATGIGSIHLGSAEVDDRTTGAVVGASFTISYTPATTSFTVRDDGAGALAQITLATLTAPGTINYNTGAYSFTTTAGAKPHNAAPVLATYSVENFDMNPISKGVWSEEIKIQVQGNADYFDATTQSYSKYDVNVAEYNDAAAAYVVVESYEALDFTDTGSADYMPDVLNELSDLVNVIVPALNENIGQLNGRSMTIRLGGGAGSAKTFAPADLLGDTLVNAGLEIGKRSVSISYTADGEYASGTITTVAGASLVDTETFTLSDGVNTPTVFEFDSGGGVTVGNVAVPFTALDTATQVRDAIITAINGVGATLLITASSGGAALVNLVNETQGTVGNTLSSDTVVNAGFVVTNMTGGLDQTAGSIVDDGTGILTGDVDPTYATTISYLGTDIDPNTVNYTLGVANFKTADAVAPATLVTATFYTAPEESVHEELFGDVTKQFTDSLAVQHYQSGSDGTFTALTYSRTQFTDPTLQATNSGLYALNRIDEIMQVIIPDFAGDVVVTGDLLDYAAARANLPSGGDRFIILTVPVGSSPQEAVDWFRFDLGRFSKFAALYWPWVKVADPLANGRPLLMPPLGHVAGIYARTDAQRNVGKAPAGTTDGALNFLVGLEYEPTQGERDFVYPNKINSLISSSQTGLAVWGARTIAIESEWRYIQARRLFMFLEKSIYNATGWIVFENNGPGLWARIKAQLDGFLNGLFKEGLFFGNSPSQAYFVIVDDTNNDASSIEAGQVIIDVGVAPNRPAEFVRFRFQQKTISS